MQSTEAPHYPNSQNSIISFGHVDSYAKTFLILYPSLENSTTPIAIFGSKQSTLLLLYLLQNFINQTLLVCLSYLSEWTELLRKFCITFFFLVAASAYCGFPLYNSLCLYLAYGKLEDNVQLGMYIPYFG